MNLFWDGTYAIAMALLEEYPELDPVTVGLYELAELVVGLPGFADDPALANERLLHAIQITWFEERKSP